MLRSLLARYLSVLLICCSFVSCLVQASTGAATGSLQDEIKQSEANASQAVLDVLQADTKPNQDLAQNQTSSKETSATTQKPPSSTSNTDKAFTPTDNTSSNTPSSSNHSPNKNPWIQPNPWAKQPPNIWEKNAKVNPYANAAIPGPTPPNSSTSTTINSPPNIFTPSSPTNSNNP